MGEAAMRDQSRRSYLKASGVATAIGLSGLSGCLGGIVGGGTPTVSFGWIVPVENIGSVLTVPGIQEQAPNLGQEYEFESASFSSTPSLVNALAAGDLDAGIITATSFGNAVEQEAIPGGFALTLTDFWDAHPDHFGFHIFSRGDSDITEPEDLEGKQLAVNATGTMIHGVYVRQLLDIGLDPQSDVEFIELAFPAHIQALKDGRVDVIILPALFSLQAAQEDFNLIYTSHEVFEPYPAGYLAVTNDAISEKENGIRSFNEDYISVLEWMRNNRPEAVSLTADHFGLPEAGLDAMMLTENDYYRGDLSMDSDALSVIMSEMVDMGFVEQNHDWASYATNEYRP